MLKDDKPGFTLPDIDLVSILRCTPGYVYWKNLDSVYIGCNQEFLQVALTDEISKVIGKTDYTLPWGSDPEVPPKFVQDDKYVISTGKSIVVEDTLVIKDSRGLTVLVRTEKKPLFDKQGNIIGVLGIAVNITDQKESERRYLESERQRHQAALQEKEHYAMLARKVAHDINSPVAALRMMIDTYDELSEDKRSFLRRATESILDIANNLLIHDRDAEDSFDSEIEFRQPLLVADLVGQLLSEKKVQYQQHSVQFKTVIADEAQFAFINAQKSGFRRSMSNLINNAVDALENKKDGVVTVQLTVDADSVIVGIQDNGKGMSRDKVEKILDRQRFTEGKENGHGLGLQQVWDMLECNLGTIAVQSTVDHGTSIQLVFPRNAAPSWIAKEMHLAPDNIIVILDDDESIHTAWDLRFASFMSTYPKLRLHHFTHGQEALDFVSKLTSQQKDRVLFLSDFELLNQKSNGLQIIEASKINDAILVTSYYSNPKIRDVAARLNVKILPKQMASVIPIDVK